MKDLFGNEIEEPKAKGSRNVYALLQEAMYGNISENAIIPDCNE